MFAPRRAQACAPPPRASTRPKTTRRSLSRLLSSRCTTMPCIQAPSFKTRTGTQRCSRMPTGAGSLPTCHLWRSASTRRRHSRSGRARSSCRTIQPAHTPTKLWPHPPRTVSTTNAFQTSTASSPRLQAACCTRASATVSFATRARGTAERPIARRATCETWLLSSSCPSDLRWLGTASRGGCGRRQEPDGTRRLRIDARARPPGEKL
mmetsp:Transcript_20313/g.64693  ORF Transcript_20313/g.64693 Transcript_20313/m.64693 type:complete len:208 (+) Transcript_20313:560-1183(+)